jgi:hypothetical protein
MLYCDDAWHHVSPFSDHVHQRILRPNYDYSLSVPTLPKHFYLMLREICHQYHLTNWEAIILAIQTLHDQLPAAAPVESIK